MLGFREGESHSPTLKTSCNLIGLGLQIPAELYVCREQQKQTFGKICEILSCWKCDIPIGQYTLFPETLFFSG